jgi:hypothetical protein
MIARQVLYHLNHSISPGFYKLNKCFPLVYIIISEMPSTLRTIFIYRLYMHIYICNIHVFFEGTDNLHVLIT